MLKYLLLFVLFFILSGCLLGEKKLVVNFKNPSAFETLNTTITSVKIQNNQLIVNGTGLTNVKTIKIKNNSLNEVFSVESANAGQLIANSAHNIAIGIGQIFDLVLSDAIGSAIYQVTFTMGNKSVTAPMLDTMGAQDGYVLKYDGINHAWKTAPLASSQNYIGTWDAAHDIPNLAGTSPISGDYYIVSVAGTYNSVAYDIGDWIIYNGLTWDRIASSSATKLSLSGGELTGDLTLDTLLRLKGPSNFVTLKASSLLAADIMFILPSTVGASGQVLTTDGTGVMSWSTLATSTIPSGSAGGDLSGSYPNPTITSLAATKIADGSVTNAQFQYLSGVSSNLQTQLDGKQASITAGTTTQYYRGDKNFATLDTSAVSENGNLYFTNPRSLAVPLTGFDNSLTGAIVATDTVLQAFGRTQNQLDGKFSSASFVNWAITGAQTIDPSRLNLGIANAGKAVATDGSGFIVTNGATATELGYLSGVTSAIQTQLNAKQALISKSTVQDISKVRIYGANSTNYVELSAATLTGNRSLIFPDTNGTSGNILSTDGSGNLSWIAPPVSSVTSVNTLTGAVTLTSTNISEGTNLYHTDARVLGTVITTPTLTNAIIATGDTLQVAAGKLQAQINNKESAITAGTPAQYLRGDKSLSTFATDAIASVISSYSLDGTSKPSVANTDSVSTAFGKVQKYINDINSDYVSKSDATVANTVSGVLAFNSIGSLKIGYTPTNATDATSKSYVDSIAGTWQVAGSNAYRSTGYVGIGLSAPTASLTVAPAASIAGTSLSATNGTSILTTGSSLTLNAGDYVVPSISTTQARAVTVGGTGTSFTISPAYASTVSGEAFSVYPAMMNINNGKFFVQGNTGYVGIGTISPQDPLEVVGTASAIRATDGAVITRLFSNGTTGKGYVGTLSSSPFTLRTGGADRVTIDTSGNVGIGTASPGYQLDLTGSIRAVGFYYSSDRRLKKDIQPLLNPVEKIKALQGVSFKWKKTGIPTMGFIAQDVEKVIPEVVKTDKKSSYKSVEYGNIVALVVEALKHFINDVESHFANSDRSIANIQEENTMMKKQLQNQQEQIDQLSERLKKLEQK
jgi:polyhydroxyalkanoate synthesis regulator phasin